MPHALALALVAGLLLVAVVPVASAAPQLPCGSVQDCRAEVVWVLQCAGDSLGGHDCQGAPA
jgi:hypothetical protein